jgi:hypothetical protein
VTAIPGAIDPSARNNLPATTGYIYRGTKREDCPDLITANRQLMAARAEAEPVEGQISTFEWGRLVRQHPSRHRRKDPA